MKKNRLLNFTLIVSCLTVSAPAVSMSNADRTCMSQVSMNFSAERWVNSQTSLVSIGLRASVPARDADKVTEAIKTKLAGASNVKGWRLVNLTRNEGESGLMMITGQAVARLNNNQLSALQAELKALNKPGEKYSIDDVDYQPDLQTLNQARAELRTDLYTQIITGNKALNAALPSAKHAAYRIHTINFNEASLAEPVAYAAGVRMAKNTKLNKDSSLSGKMKMSAYVTYGAMTPDCTAVKATP